MSRGIALLFSRTFGTRRGWGIQPQAPAASTTGKDPVPIVQEAGWAPGSVWTGGKPRPHRDSISDRPALSQSLYRLTYRAHRNRVIGNRKNYTGSRFTIWVVKKCREWWTTWGVRQRKGKTITECSWCVMFIFRQWLGCFPLLPLLDPFWIPPSFPSSGYGWLFPLKYSDRMRSPIFRFLVEGNESLDSGKALMGCVDLAQGYTCY